MIFNPNDIKNRVIKNAHFDGNKFDYDTLYDYTFEDCTFENVNLMATFKRCKLINCTFNNSKTEFTFLECEFKNFEFSNCKGSIQFDKCKFSHQTTFDNCTFRYVDYIKCEVQGVLFNYSNIQNIHLLNSNLSLVTFVKSEIKKIDLVSMSSLENTIFKACKINNISKDATSKTSNIDIKK